MVQTIIDIFIAIKVIGEKMTVNIPAMIKHIIINKNGHNFFFIEPLLVNELFGLGLLSLTKLSFKLVLTDVFK